MKKAESAWNVQLIYGGLKPIVITASLALATESKNKAAKVSFNMIHSDPKCLQKIKKPTYCPEHGELQPDEVGKGLEVAKGEMKLVPPDLIEAIEMEGDPVLSVEYWCELSEVNDLFWDRKYYLLPEERDVATYSSLFFELQESGRGGFCRFVRAKKEYMGMVMPVNGVLGVQTMFAYEDLRWTDDLLVDVGKKAREAQKDILDLQTESFDPDLIFYKYRYNEQEVVEIVKSGKKPKKTKKPPITSVKGDLESQLEATLAALKKAA